MENMKKKNVVLSTVLFSVLLLLPMANLPVAIADVYVPPGPPLSMDAWISPYLFVFDTQDMLPIGWYYSDGPMYDPITQMEIPKIHKRNPLVLWPNRVDIPWSTEVMILGFIPDVRVAPDQAPPPVEIVITWNGIPWVVTLNTTNIVGYEYPPLFYDDIPDVYEFAWPAEDPNSFKDASGNIWVGDVTYIWQKFFEQVWEEEFDVDLEIPSWWWEVFYGYVNGYWFWYKFHPNVGDWIAWDSQGETKFPPTYDITALFEYSTSQIWFPHVAFDVSLLEVHKDVFWTTDVGLFETVTIENVGKANATELDFIQTFPGNPKHGVTPVYDSAMARIDDADPDDDYDGRTVPWTRLPGFGDPGNWPYMFQDPFDHLAPGEIMTISMDLTLYNFDDWAGTIVFDSMVSAHEIPPWKEPIALHSITIGFSQRFVVMIGDNRAHAAPTGIDYFDAPHAYGGDPGRDEVMFTGDDLDYFPVIDALAAQGITVFTVNYGSQIGDTRLNFDTIADRTGGVYYAGGSNWDVQIANEIQNRIPDIVGRGDVVFTVDLTGSMSGNLGDVQTKIKSLIDNLPPGTLDLTFGLGTHVDYPAAYNSYGYAAEYGDAAFGDYAWNMDLDLTPDRTLVKNTVDALTTYFGGDGPQNYVRVLFETQFFSWRGITAMDWAPLWCGWKLYLELGPPPIVIVLEPDMLDWRWRFDIICEWWVPTPIKRDELEHPPPEMTLDPIPVDLNGDGVINAQDVALVRQASIGLIPYDLRMDINVNSEIDTQDLAAYKLAAG